MQLNDYCDYDDGDDEMFVYSIILRNKIDASRMVSTNFELISGIRKTSSKINSL